MWTREELAWVAGLFEGEGSITCFAGKQENGSPRRSLRLNTSIKMTDLDVLERACRITGLGAVYGPYRSSYPGAKPHWQWNVQRSAQAYALLVALWPWFDQRRHDRAREVILAWIGCTDHMHGRTHLVRLEGRRTPDGRFASQL